MPNCGSADPVNEAQVQMNRRTLSPDRLMIPKYQIEFSLDFDQGVGLSRHQTDDPVTCEEFLKLLLEKKVRIVAVKHEGMPMEGKQLDRMLKTAASMMASDHLCASLGIAPDEEKYRFGFAA